MADPAHIRHLARLARLHLTDEEAARYAEEAARILASFEALPARAAARAAPAPESAGRADEPVEESGPVVDAILAEVPRKEGRLVAAPRGGESS